LTDPALDPDVATHQPHILPADRQSQAGTSNPALRLARLLERLEDRFQPVCADADAGVPHFKAQAGGWRKAHAQADLTAVGELDGIGQQVEQCLA
jgi:hypothetical protein